ncbi:hypothetical protein R6Q57_018758 [Mikania cordata]
MRFRWKEVTKNSRPELSFPWTILPPQFYDILCETLNYGALPFSNGMKGEYHVLWDVDTVYIPIGIEYIHWFLLRVDMRTLEMASAKNVSSSHSPTLNYRFKSNEGSGDIPVNLFSLFGLN